MGKNIDEIIADCLSALVYTRGSTIGLFEYQQSELSDLGRNRYVEFLRSELSEKKIDKLLEEAYMYDFQNVTLIKEPFVSTANLNEIEVYNSNDEFINNKRVELNQIYNSLFTKQPNPKIENETLVNTFVWLGNKEPLKLLHSELIKNKLIANIDFEIFEKGFSGIATKTPLNIPWTDITKKKLTSKISLHYLLDKLHPKFIEFPYVFGYTAFSNVFCDKDYKTFVGIKQSMSNYNNLGLKGNIIKDTIDTIIDKIENLP